VRSGSVRNSIRFGDFELDTRAGELRRAGVAVRLQDQPLQILIQLLAHPREVVTRDELRQALWSQDTFVDFEHALNKAVNKLRTAIGDSAESPQLIETLPRRGYRWIGPDVKPDPDITPTEPQASRKAWPLRGTLAGAGAVVLAATLAVWWWSLRPKPASSVAVLPFLNLTGSPGNDYLSDGLTEELIDTLAQQEHLSVVARTSSFSFKGKTADVREIGAKLHATAVVEGSVRQEGEELRVTAQLIRTSDGFHLWSKSYDLRVVRLLQVQQALAGAITSAVLPHLGAGMSKVPGCTADAYDLVLHAQHEQRTRAGFQRANSLYEQAISKDPQCSLALARLAYNKVNAAYRGMRPPPEARRAVFDLTERARRANDSSWEVHLALAQIKTFEWDWPAAAAAFQKAIALSPGAEPPHSGYGRFLARTGHTREAIEQYEIARRLDPLAETPEVLLAEAYFFARDYYAGLAVSRRAEGNFPHTYGPPIYTGLLEEQLGNHQAALDAIRKAIELSGDKPTPDFLGLLAHALASAGERAKAQEILDGLLTGEHSEYVPPMVLARIYAGLGESTKALDALEKGYQVGDPIMVWLKMDPRLDSLRGDPRFKVLMEKMHFN
jgi:TolB-like protein/DNA-binding winged helix-turn-helix (wHTH) protein